MLRTYSSYKLSTKIWKKTSVKIDGTMHNITFTDLPKHRIEDFLDFQMKFYARHEITHRISGLVDNAEAMAEYRTFFRSIISNPSCYNIVCSVENHNGLPNIAAALTYKIIKQYEPYEDYVPKSVNSKETVRFFKIVRDRNNLCTVPDLMKKYDLPRFISGKGISVHPDYRKYGLAKEFLALTRVICKEHGVQMAGSWYTSLGWVGGRQNTKSVGMSSQEH